MSFGFISCHKQKKEVKLEEAGLVVENTISADREYMYLHAGEDYTWYETQVTLKNYMDEDSTSAEIEKIVSVFQVIEQIDSCSFDTYVYTFNHKNGKTEVVSVKDFWIENEALNDQEINLTFKEAYDRLIESNCPKPHSRQCALRRQVGSIDANPQYIFGNTHEQVYVDAVDGTVSTVNPAFNPN